jgi:hypothetical protein
MHRIINVGQNYTPNNYIPQARLVSDQHLVSIILQLYPSGCKVHQVQKVLAA